MQGIQDNIMSSLLPAYDCNNEIASQNYAVSFELESNLLSFSETHDPEEQPGKGFKTAFTLTGSDLEVQGATCSNYMQQTWPITGETIIELVKGALCIQQGCVFNSMLKMFEKHHLLLLLSNYI